MAKAGFISLLALLQVPKPQGFYNRKPWLEPPVSLSFSHNQVLQHAQH